MPTESLVARLRAAGCVFAEDEAALLMEAAPGADERESLVARRIAGEPLEHLLGWAAFRGLRIAVEPGTFVPRVRTELLADEALRAIAGLAHPVVVELCSGVAPVATAVAVERPDAEVHAADLDPNEVRVAARNLEGIGRVHRGDLFEALPSALTGRVDVLVANAPYVPADEIAFMPSEARDHEPLLALDGGSDGLDLHRRIAAGAPEWLAPTGVLIIETSEEQAERTADAMRAAGLEPRVVRDEDRDATAVVGERP